MTENNAHALTLKWLGIDTYKDPVIYMRTDCHICRSEGFEARARIKLTLGNRSIIATLNTTDETLLASNEASLSKYAWDLLGAKTGDIITLSHPKPLRSLSYIRAKMYDNILNTEALDHIIEDVVSGRLSDVHIAAFLTACSGNRLNPSEILGLTSAMIHAGEVLDWNSPLVVDKHCVGGLPGNRTTLIIVPIISAFGLLIPKTSSRSVTSPAGTADTMEVLAPVDLNIQAMQKVVEKENGCIIWGGSVALSPADDILIQVARAIDLDSEGQLVASILSKKIAAGSSHIVIDIPIGPTAKVRTLEMGELLKNYLLATGASLGVFIEVIFTDGSKPVGHGIGPSLEARDVLSVLQCQKNAPQDLRERALMLAGKILEFSPKITPGTGKSIATELLNNGQAWKKFQAICDAQGGMRTLPIAKYQKVITSRKGGCITNIDNRLLARLAKLAGAPRTKSAGIDLHVTTEALVEKKQPLFTLHADSSGELAYAMKYLEHEPKIIEIK